MNIADEIRRLHELHQAGALTDAEFAQAKAKLLSAEAEASSTHNAAYSGLDSSLEQLNRFRRSTTDCWLGGICGGLGKFTGLESWIWRLLFVLFTCYFGAGLVIYVMAWIFVPEEE
ncbi:PspC domain-containing protein [Undibacterium oligocarboniphilum]|uniref:PspC domain-containing protein n=1 Tax=Undibacterium oligocarboniphilum TaxID=666702 RepID=A0A850QBV4_9BURK|nr:PspC domain-containing protein [Undibacterium oligocarboniphilum]MBC3868768.1 PspC domain-containing protein [Undibacterium oligocarboniphilum]NVO76749.1 PspC domain-containing protein [Undibacterium oligocarboniphilum]